MRRAVPSWSALALVVVAASAAQRPLIGQSRAPATTPAPNAAWDAPKTAWGDPDLQGIWTNATITPLERPAAFAGREFLTEEESAALDQAAQGRYDRRAGNTVADVDAAYNQFWWDRGNTVATRRTSLIVDPPDGRLPALTADGQRRAAEVAEAGRRIPRGPDRNLAERCLTRGAPVAWRLHNNVHLLQAPGYVAILQEMIHEVRIIPLDGRPHLPPDVNSGWETRAATGRAIRWSSRRRTITTMSRSIPYNCCPGAGRHLHIVERYRRVSADTVDYRFT